VFKNTTYHFCNVEEKGGTLKNTFNLITDYSYV